MKPEIRNFQVKELRTEGDGNILVGYASIFNSESEDLGGFKEVVTPTAFNKTLQENRKIKALMNHNTDFVLGAVNSGTLTLTVDDIGLRAEVTLPDTSYAKDLKESVKRGDIDGMSFGFSVVKDLWENVAGVLIRYLQELRLFEVSFVAFPAYSATSVNLRDLLSEEKENALTNSDQNSQLEVTEPHSEESRSIQPQFNPSSIARYKYF